MNDMSEKNSNAIADWAGDIVSLVGHLEEVLDRQLSVESPNGKVNAFVKKLHDAVRDDKQRGEAFQESIGSTAGNPVVKTGTNLLGKAAGMIDQMRDDSASKALRDDNVAMNGIMVAYAMLHTTSMALENSEAEKFAEMGMRTYAPLIEELNMVLPDAVVADLVKNGDVEVMDESAADRCREAVHKIWSEA